MRPLVRTRCPGRALLVALLLTPLCLVLTPGGSVDVAQAAAPRTTSSAARYVALGDSYASGEGLAPYEAGTETPSDSCHRSASQSYPELLQRTRLRAYEKGVSVACSGALTASVLVPTATVSDEPAQITALSDQTRTVTLTVGGNDAAFRSILTDCIYSPLPLPQVQALVPGRAGCRARDDLVVSERIGYLAGDPTASPALGSVPLAQLLLVVQAQAPNATILMSGYPQFIGTTPTDGLGCAVGALGPISLYVTEDDARWFRSKTDDLNAAIRGAVQQARRLGARARYVDVAHAFHGHNICDTKTSWLNALLITGGGTPALDPASFHPTARGQRAYAQAILRTGRSYRDW